MANYNALILGADFQLTGAVGTLPASAIVSAWNGGGVSASAPTLAAAFAPSANRTESPTNFAASVEIRSFYHLFYERIHIAPVRIDFGNILNNQVRTVEIWNAYYATKNLQAVTPTGLTGITINATTPKVFAGLESATYNLTVTVEGAPNFDGNYLFDFSNAEDPTLILTGRRVLPFPFRHNWAASMLERFAWLTKLHESENGTEQAIRYRSKPRRELEQEITLARSNTPRDNAELRQQFLSLMAAWQHRVFAVPLWMDATTLAVTQSIGATVIPVPAQYRDYVADGFLLLWRDESTVELAEILSVQTTTVTLKRGLLAGWTANRTILAPARLARATPDVPLTDIAAGLSTVKIRWSIEIKESVSARAVAWPSPPVYRTAPVFMLRSNAERPAHALRRRFDSLDYQTGYKYFAGKWNQPQATLDHRHVLQGRQLIAEFFGWLNDRAGRLKAAWFPTWQFDLTLLQPIGDTATAFVVKNNGYTRGFVAGETRRDIMIRLNSGATLFRRITGATEGTGAGLGTETLALDSPLGQVVNVADVDRISFLRYARLDSDEIEVEWLTVDKTDTNYKTTDLLRTI